MEEFLSKQFYMNTVKEWFIALIIIAAGVIAAKIVYWIFSKFVKKLTEKTKTRIDDILIDMLEEPVVFGIAILGFYLGVEQLNMTEWMTSWTHKIYYILIAINITWLVSRVLDALIVEYLVPLTEKTESDLDDQLIPVVRKLLRTVIWVVGIIVALNNAGYDVGALIAGLGIGGLALAMAAKDSVENIFGGVTIFADKPFTLGDRIIIGDYDGIVEDVGIRKTRIRTLAGRVVTIPNSTFTKSPIENISLEPSRKVALQLGLTYDTTPENIEKAIEILKQILKDNEDTTEDADWTLFDTYGDFALGITFVYKIKKGEHIPTVQTKISLEILKRFNAAGLEFAFPTQTIYNIKQEA